MAAEFTTRGVDVTAERAVAESEPGAFADLYGRDFARFAVRTAVRTDGAGRGTARAVVLDGDADDVVEVEYLDGQVRYERAATLAVDAGAGRGGALARAIEGDASGVGDVRRLTVALPADVADALEELDRRLTWVDREPMDRSMASIAIDVLAPVLIDPVARVAAGKLATWLEKPAADDDPPAVRRKKAKKPGVYRVGPGLLLEPGDRLDAPPPAQAGDDPWLLLVHGTFSNTEAGFRGLRGTGEWRALTDRYGDRVLALEHPTLSLTPAENALEAVRLLPEGARLHVVSHSRGGLVGDVLSLAAAQDPDVSPYGRDHPDVTALPELRAAVGARGITVTRFARVAAPARGTTLASRRLDAWASLALNVVKLVPVLRETGIAELIRKVVVTLLQQRTDPRVLPGVEAMMPESACVRMLNTAPPRAVSDGLASLTGDLDGHGFLNRALVAVVDLFYGGANDLVVDSSSMTRGLARPDERVAPFKGVGVDHFSYFGNAPSRSALQRWLDGDGVDVRGFTAVDAVDADDTGETGGDRGPAPAPPDATVLLVPDALGCVVEDGGGRTLWPDVRVLAAADGPATALGDAPDRRPTDLTGAYAALRAGLRTAGAVVPVLWDACRPLDAAALEFRRALAAALDAAHPVHVVAHGAGALVVERARDLPDDGAELWASWRRRGGRCVYLSPPLHGSWAAEAALRGLDALATLVRMLRPGTTADDVTARLAALEALTAQRPTSRQAAPAPGRWEGIVAVYGAPARTPCGESSSTGLRASTGGDGNVLFPGTDLPGLRKRYATVGVWDLLTRRAAAEDVAALLAGGSPPTLLGGTPPPVSTDDAWDRPVGQLLFPTPDDLVRAALHGAAVARAPRPQLRVGVVHGDITCVDDPVILGSFDGTPIAGAERALDGKLDGALSRRQQLGQHAGAPGTLGMFSRRDGRPAACIIGIGDPGELTPGRLSAGVTQAVVRLAAAALDATGGDPEPLEIATVLIGTSGASGMSVSASVTAVVNGVRRANRRLRGLPGSTTVAALRFVELYDERAAEAVHALQVLPAGPTSVDTADPAGETLAVASVVQSGRGGRRGQPRREDRDDEWRTVRVGAADPDRAAGGDGLSALSFTSIGAGAGADQQISATQRALVDRLVHDSITDPRVDPQLYNTLYELLLPPSMKGSARERDNIMYVVDAQAAALPLELLGTRNYDGTVLPIAVDVGVVRRLETRTLRTTSRVATGRNALVVGNPPSTRYPQLPGAAREAREVAATLRAHGFQVTELVADGPDAQGITATAIMNALFRREFRVVHIAAHGVYDERRPAASGVVIGDDVYLTALEIQRMRAAPEIVFLNCCHSGAMAPVPLTAVPTDDGDRRVTTSDGGWRPDRTAASISRALVDSGVRAVVAAGWAVDDRAATAFATDLYRRLLDGADLGHAVQQARRAIHDEFTEVNTWGAYQVYGPPAYRLAPGGGRSADDGVPVSRREFRDALTELKRSDDTARTVRRLHELLDAAEEDWYGGAEYELVGELQTQLGDYPAAIAAYKAGLSRWSGTVRVRGVEQIANLEAKLAVDEHDRSTAAGLDPQKLFRSAERRIAALIAAVGPTPERWGIRASLWRRRAVVATGAARHEAITKSTTYYRRGADLHRTARRAPDPYTEINYITMSAVAALYGLPTPDLEPLLAAVATTPEDAEPDFWAQVAAADALLAGHLVRSTLTDDAAAAVATAYTGAFAAGSTPGHRRTVAEHVDILRRLMPDDRPDEHDRLAAVAERLRVWSPRR